MGPAALDIGTATQAQRAGIGHEDARFCRHISTEVPGMFWLVAAAWRLPSPHDPPSDGRQRAAVVRSNLAALAVNKPMAAYGTELRAAMPVHRPPSEAQQTPTKPHSTILDLYDRGSLNKSVSRLARLRVSIWPKGRLGSPLHRVRCAQRGALPNARLCAELQAQRLLAQSP